MKKRKTKIIIPIVLLIAIITVVIIFLCSDIFSAKEPKDIISRAFDNTFQEAGQNSDFLKLLNFKKYAENNEFSVDAQIKTEIPKIGDIAINANQSIVNDEIVITGDVDISYVSPVTYNMLLTNEKIKIKIPLLDSRIFTMDYSSKENSFLSSVIDAELLGDQLEYFYKSMISLAAMENHFDSVFGSVKEAFSEVKFEKTDDNPSGDTSAEVYKASLSKEATSNIMDILFEKSIFLNNDISISYYELKSEFLNNVQTDLYIGVRDEKISFIHVENGKKSYDILLNGKQYRLSDFSIKKDGKAIASLISDYEKNSRCFSLSDNSFSITCSLDNFREHLKINIISGYDSYDISVKIKEFEDSISFDVDYFDLGDTYLGGVIKISSGAKPSSMEGEEFDLSSASKEDYQTLGNTMYSELLKALGW